MQLLKKKKMSIFCGVTPDNLKRLEPLLKVFYQQCTDFMTRNMPKKDEPIGVLLMMDELSPGLFVPSIRHFFIGDLTGIVGLLPVLLTIPQAWDRWKNVPPVTRLFDLDGVDQP